MKVLFLCPSLEPGRNGVGDYTRRLAAECIRQGAQAEVVSLHDADATMALREEQTDGGARVPVLRLPMGMSWHAKRKAFDASGLGRDVDIKSLQFVPFGYQPKGLPFALGRELVTAFGQGAWHLMFHELWLGLEAGSSTKHRLWGAVQRGITLRLVRHLRPEVVHTQAQVYRHMLQSCSTEATLLPLFGNIPAARESGWALVEAKLKETQKKEVVPGQRWLAAIFGTVHPQWDPYAVLPALARHARDSGRRLTLMFLGNSHRTDNFFAELESHLGAETDILRWSQVSAEDVSRLLQTIDVGLATSPWALLDKSGATAAMLEHGVPVLVSRDEWVCREPMPTIQHQDPYALRFDASALARLPGRRNPESLLPSVAAQFMSDIRQVSDAAGPGSLEKRAAL